MALDVDILLLAAGFGKRLLPVTAHTPKPLIKIGGRTLIEYNLELIARSGATRVIVNLHHLGEKIRAAIGDGSKWGLSVEYSEEPVILDTGGAIKNIESRLSERQLVVINSDILLGPDFKLLDIVEGHRANSHSPVITASLRPDPQAEKFGAVDIDPDGLVCGFLGQVYRSVETPRRLMYLGVQVIEREVLKYMPERGGIFSITRDTWCKVLSAGGVIAALEYNGYWNDVGTPERVEQASKDIGKVFGLS